MNVGDRISFSVTPGCELDITIDELEEREDEDEDDVLIKRATVHAVNLTPPMVSFGKLPDGWVDAR